MDRGPEPSAHPETGVSAGMELDCAGALELVRQFVAGREDVEARPRLRQHLARCPVCRDQYRAEVVLVAKLARGGARSLSSVRGLEERAGRKLVFERRGGRRVSLARLLLPAMGLYALFAIAGPGEGGHVRCTTLGDGVLCAGVPLAVGDPAVELERGALCLTNLGRARVSWSGSAVVVEPESALLFERRDPLRARLFGGRVMIEGTIVLSTALGVLEVESGSVIVELDPTGLTVTCARGVARLVDVAGTETIDAGQSATRALPRTVQR